MSDALLQAGQSVRFTYAAYSRNMSERLCSSSGGVFSLIAEEILSVNGVIYGVAMSDDCLKAEYIRVLDMDGLTKLRSSKYIQAHIGDTLKQVKTDLENGLEVLFTGTGCQINALFGFLGIGSAKERREEKYPNLYCVDVICHGTPSPALWREYVSYTEKKYRLSLKGVNFRCKDKDWHDFGMKEISKDKKVVYIPKSKDPYMLMFLRNYCLRPSCYACKAKEVKLSDMTIADFWGIDKIAPEMTDGKGTSLVLVRTDKGERLFQSISDKLTFKAVTYEEGVADNPVEYRSSKRPVERDVFFTDMHEMTFEDLAKKYAVPTPVPFSHRIKKTVKNMLIKAGLYGGGMSFPMVCCLYLNLRKIKN